MKSELLARSPLLALPLLALFLFLVVFFTVFVVTMRRSAHAYEGVARLPIDDEGDGQRDDSRNGDGS